MVDVELTSTFFNEVCNSVCLIVGHLQNIAEAIENDLDNLSIFHCEQVTEGGDHPFLDEVCNLWVQNKKRKEDSDILHIINLFCKKCIIFSCI